MTSKHTFEFGTRTQKSSDRNGWKTFKLYEGDTCVLRHSYEGWFKFPTTVKGANKTECDALQKLYDALGKDNKTS